MKFATNRQATYCIKSSQIKYNLIKLIQFFWMFPICKTIYLEHPGTNKHKRVK